jgi:hypothetical protein
VTSLSKKEMAEMQTDRRAASVRGHDAIEGPKVRLSGTDMDKVGLPGADRSYLLEASERLDGGELS